MIKAVPRYYRHLLLRTPSTLVDCMRSLKKNLESNPQQNPKDDYHRQLSSFPSRCQYNKKQFSFLVCLPASSLHWVCRLDDKPSTSRSFQFRIIFLRFPTTDTHEEKLGIRSPKIDFIYCNFKFFDIVLLVWHDHTSYAAFNL